MKKCIKPVVLLLCALLVALGLEALQVATQPKQYESEPRIIREAGEIDFSSCEITGASVKNDAVSVPAEGCEIFCDFGSAVDVEIFRLTSKKHLKADVPVTVWYAGAGEDFSDDRSVSFTADTASTFWDAPVPVGNWQKFRVKIDGKMTLKSITYAQEQKERIAVAEPLRLKRILIMAAILYPFLLFWAYSRPDRRIASAVRGSFSSIRQKPTRFFAGLLLFLLSGVAAGVLAGWAVSGKLFGALLWPQILFCCGVGLVFACMVTFRRTLTQRPEILFLVICLTVGTLLSFLLPPVSVLSWDDDFHYLGVVNASYLGEDRYTSMDVDIHSQVGEMTDFFNLSTRDAALAQQDLSWHSGVVWLEEPGLELTRLYYLCPGLGLFLGRVLGLPFHWIYSLGRFFNLLTYALAGYFAIRRLKSGKMILSCVLLIPTSFYMACVYSYDPGVIAFTALGLAYWFAEWQEPEKPLAWGNALVMVGALVFGCLTKAIYFPLLFLPAFLPKTKFASAGSARKALWFRLLLLLGMLVLIASFVLPMLSGDATSDARGGDNVDAYGQMNWVLGNLGKYLAMMFDEIGYLINPANALSMFSIYAYLGYGGYTLWTLIMLAVAAFLDKNESDRALIRCVWLRVIGLVLLLGTLCLVITSMYIIYNPVGSDGIGGVQPRYVLPLIFPSMMLLGSGFLSRLLPRKKYPWITGIMNAVFLGSSAFILFSYTWSLVFSRFTLG